MNKSFKEEVAVIHKLLQTHKKIMSMLFVQTQVQVF